MKSLVLQGFVESFLFHLDDGREVGGSYSPDFILFVSVAHSAMAWA